MTKHPQYIYSNCSVLQVLHLTHKHLQWIYHFWPYTISGFNAKSDNNGMLVLYHHYIQINMHAYKIYVVPKKMKRKMWHYFQIEELK